MNRKISFYRWIYFFLIWLIGMTLVVLASEFFIGPAIQWLFNDIPYSVPSLHRIERMSSFVLFMGFFGGTVCWLYEKLSSGR